MKSLEQFIEELKKIEETHTEFFNKDTSINEIGEYLDIQKYLSITHIKGEPISLNTHPNYKLPKEILEECKQLFQLIFPIK